MAIEVNQMRVLPLQRLQENEQKKLDKKKEIMCFRCIKVGHNSHECKEELPTTSGGKRGIYKQGRQLW